jgi:SPP1 gp7 family putative phage head morphogenesis protein
MSLALKNRLALLRRVQSSEFSVRGLTPHSELHTPNWIDFSTENVDLVYALQLPPEKAIDYFKSKGFVFSWDWEEIWQDAHSRAFTVAKALRLDVLQTIRDELQKAFDEGMMLRDFQKDLEPKLKALGWWGKQTIGDETGATTVQLGSPWRLQTIYDTNMSTSYMSGRWKEFIENTDDRPWFQYVAVMDSRTRPSHRALNGKVFRYDDPFWDSFWPPNDWG